MNAVVMLVNDPKDKFAGDTGFTEGDVKLLKTAYVPYMELIDYDSDWDLSPNPFIETEYSSTICEI